MSVNLKNVQTKLQAILDKDVEKIVATKVYIPFSGTAKSTQDVNAWLQKRVKLLEAIKKMRFAKDVEAAVKRVALNLCESCRKMVADPNFPDVDECPCAKDYDAVCMIRLYKYSLEE